MPENHFKVSFLHPKYWGIWLGLSLLRLLSFAPYYLKFKIGDFIGQIMYKLAKSRRGLALKNITMCFPEKTPSEHQKIVKDHFKSLGIYFIEMSINLWGKHRHNNSKNEFQHFTYHGLENLEKHNNTGILILTPHFTTLEITGLMLSFITSYRPLYRPHNNPLMEYWITKSRTYKRTVNQKTLQILPISNKATRTLIKALRAKVAIGILPDQRYRSKGKVDVPFFGVSAPSNPGINKLAKLGKAKVLPVFTRRIGSKYQLTILPALENFPSGDDYKDTLRLHKLYEAEIKKNPSQYLWTHNRWDISF